MDPLEIAARLLAGATPVLVDAYFLAIEFGLIRARQYPGSEFDTPGLRRVREMTGEIEDPLDRDSPGETRNREG